MSLTESKQIEDQQAAEIVHLRKYVWVLKYKLQLAKLRSFDLYRFCQYLSAISIFRKRNNELKDIIRKRLELDSRIDKVLDKYFGNNELASEPCNIKSTTEAIV